MTNSDLVMRPEEGKFYQGECELLPDPRREFFRGEPLINVLDKDTMQKRVEKVFTLLGEVLSRSFGAYGAPAIISNYPFQHVTKDGYTIMKNISFDVECGSLVDSVIYNLASSICGRLNFLVGDGTTTSIVAACSIYQAYMDHRNLFDEKYILPRDIIKMFTELKNRVVDKVTSAATPIRGDKEGLTEAIRNIVRISSNGDDQITEMISSIYNEIECPSIACELAKDGVTKKTIIKGYQSTISLLDEIYINSDGKIAAYKNADVLVFGSKVTEETYKMILKPLSNLCKMRGRHLICIAPYYDERALDTVIKRDLNNEYKNTHDVNLVLMACANTTAQAKLILSDIAMLLNTTIIDKSLERELIDAIESSGSYEGTINIDEREIEGISVLSSDMQQMDNGQKAYVISTYKEGMEVAISGIKETAGLGDYLVRLGFVDEIDCGLKSTVMKGFHYDETLYELTLNLAKSKLEEVTEKYAKLGSWNVEVAHAQNRYGALKLNMGVIEVGGDSELSQNLLKDSVDDAIRAAESAYNYGYILGGNITTSVAIRAVEKELAYEDIDPDLKKIYSILLNILKQGFADVYKTIIGNGFSNINVEITDTADDTMHELINNIAKSVGVTNVSIFDWNTVWKIVSDLIDAGVTETTTHDILVEYCIRTNQVFDLEKRDFTVDVINSCRTDIEVLSAIVDLMNILITGNQLVMTGKHNF